MNLDSSLAFFINQGPVFWAATASVGAGGALLITALFVYFRRFVTKHNFRNPISSFARTAKPEISAQPEIHITDAGYSVSAPGLAKNEESIPTEMILQDFLKRLRIAGDLLENFQDKQQNKENLYSALKTTPDFVENEFRVGTG